LRKTVKASEMDTHEPGCQVLHGVATGAIRKDRLDSYHKMRRELAYLSERQTKSAGRVEKERWKEVTLKIKAINNRKTNHA
jgi:ribosome biogenesis GTPase